MKPAIPASMPLSNTAPAVSVPMPKRDKLLRLPQVETDIGCKKSTIYTMVRKGEFPPPIRVTRRMVGWPESLVQAWIQSRIQGGAQ